MAGTTTYYGISYPTSTDYVKDGATAMQTIATGFDSAVAIPTYNNQTGTSYTFVLADAGKTVTSNNASAVTFTIPPQASVAWANNTTLTVRNLGAGVVTIAGGAGVTVTNTAQTVAQYGEVELIRTASNAWTVVPASGGASGLTLINTTSVTTQSAVNIANVFSSTYQNYKIELALSAASATSTLSIQFSTGGTASSTAYYNGGIFSTEAGTGGYFGNVNSSSVAVLSYNSGYGDSSAGSLDIFDPFAAVPTKFTSVGFAVNATPAAQFILVGGHHYVSTSYDGIKFLTGSGTFSGTIRIYGYQNS